MERKNQGAGDCVDQTSARSGEARRTPRPKGSPNRVPILSRRHPKAEPRGVGRSHRVDTTTTLLCPCNDTQRRPNRRRAGSLARRPSPKLQPFPPTIDAHRPSIFRAEVFSHFPGTFFGASRGLTFSTIRHHRISSDAIAFPLVGAYFSAQQGSSPSLSGTSRPVSRILSDGDHPSEAHRCRRAPATYPETSREQRSDGFRGQRTGLLGLAPGGVYRAAPVTRRTGGLLHHRFTLTRPLGRAVCSLWHCPAGHPGWVLPTTLLCGVRTFLSPVTRAAITRPTRPGSKSSSPNGLKRHGRTPSCPR